MPRWINFSLLAEPSAELPILQNLRRGSRELNELEDTALISEAAREQSGYIFPRQFRTHHTIFEAKLINNLENAFAWLGTNSTGPWEWSEGCTSTETTNEIYIGVYIERCPDQNAFLQMFPNLFIYEPHTPLELTKIALLRGAVPPGDMPDMPRQLPDDFLAYLRGDVSSYEAPYLIHVRPQTAKILPFRRPPKND